MTETSINDSFRFSKDFSRNHFVEVGFTLQWGWGVGVFFRWRGLIFKWGLPMGGIGFNPIQDGGAKSPPPTSFSPVTSTNVGIGH